MKDRVFLTIKKNNMLKQGDNVIVGLSGGADSVALLCVLCELSEKLGINNISACHVNHNLRGEESDRDERFCKELCERIGIPFFVKSVDVDNYCAKRRCSTEEGARELRYEALQKVDSAAKIATAHTLSDNAETLLLNLVRGTALEGLCGIPPIRDNIVRPLIECTRDDVENYLATLKQDFVIDSTNLSDDYRRNRVRHTLIPILKEINPSFERAVGRTTEALRGDKHLLKVLTDQTLQDAKIPQEKQNLPDWAHRLDKFLPYRQSWSRKIIIGQPKSIRIRCYKEILINAKQRYDTERLFCIDELAHIGSGSIQVDEQTILSLENEVLLLDKLSQSPKVEEQIISLNDAEKSQFFSICYGITLQISIIEQTEIKFFVNNRSLQFKNAIDCDRINKIITLRSRKAGDRIALVGHNCTKTLKNLLNAISIPAMLRDSLVVLSDEEGPVWLEGFGVSERVAISNDTQRAVLINIREE